MLMLLTILLMLMVLVLVVHEQYEHAFDLICRRLREVMILMTKFTFVQYPGARPLSLEGDRSKTGGSKF